jgi:hypothetical protein
VAALPKDQIPFIPLKPIILPIVIDKTLEGAWPAPSRAAIFFLGSEIAIKLTVQHSSNDIAVG